MITFDRSSQNQSTKKLLPQFAGDSLFDAIAPTLQFGPESPTACLAQGAYRPPALPHQPVTLISLETTRRLKTALSSSQRFHNPFSHQNNAARANTSSIE